MQKEKTLITLAQHVLQQEAEGLLSASRTLDTSFEKACHLIHKSQGRTIVIGMGKSGHIGRKLAATLSSTGTPSFFVHPGEAAHGDLGMITPSDVVVVLSNSGKTDEILVLLPVFKKLNIPVIAVTKNSESPLALHASATLLIPNTKEACPLNLAPTTSTTVSLALGDALAICLLHLKSFNSEDFAARHPAGTLGKQLLTLVEDVMRPLSETPTVLPTATLADSLIEASTKHLGCVLVTKPESNEILGIFTDGDLRRVLEKNQDIHHTCISDVMTDSPFSVSSKMRANDAVSFMKKQCITFLPVVDESSVLIGSCHWHDFHFLK